MCLEINDHWWGDTSTDVSIEGGITLVHPGPTPRTLSSYDGLVYSLSLPHMSWYPESDKKRTKCLLIVTRTVLGFHGIWTVEENDVNNKTSSWLPLIVLGPFWFTFTFYLHQRSDVPFIFRFSSTFHSWTTHIPRRTGRPHRLFAEYKVPEIGSRRHLTGSSHFSYSRRPRHKLLPSIHDTGIGCHTPYMNRSDCLHSLSLNRQYFTGIR